MFCQNKSWRFDIVENENPPKRTAVSPFLVCGHNLQFVQTTFSITEIMKFVTKIQKLVQIGMKYV